MKSKHIERCIDTLGVEAHVLTEAGIVLDGLHKYTSAAGQLMIQMEDGLELGLQSDPARTYSLRLILNPPDQGGLTYKGDLPAGWIRDLTRQEVRMIHGQPIPGGLPGRTESASDVFLQDDGNYLEVRYDDSGVITVITFHSR